MIGSGCRVEDPAQADVFFIPIRNTDVCLSHGNIMAAFERCGIDHGDHHNLPGMWRWLLQQPTFRDSDGSNHFMFSDAPFAHLKNGNVRRLRLSPHVCILRTSSVATLACKIDTRCYIDLLASMSCSMC